MRADNSHLDTKNDNDFNGSQKSMIGFRAFDLVPETVSISKASNKRKVIILLILVYVMFSIC